MRDRCLVQLMTEQPSVCGLAGIRLQCSLLGLQGRPILKRVSLLPATGLEVALVSAEDEAVRQLFGEQHQ